MLDWISLNPQQIMYNIQHKARKIGTCTTSITNALTRRQHKARLFNTNEILTLWEIVCGMVRFLNVLMYKMILYLSATPSIEGISFTVCFFLCPGKDVSAAVQVQPIVVTFCVIVSLYITPMCLPLLGRYPKSSQNPTFDREYLENSKSHRSLSIRPRS